MSYIVSKSPDVKMNLMVLKKHLPELAGYCERTGCKYDKEVAFDPGNGEEWVTLANVSGGNGRKLGDLIGLFYSIEWKNLTEGIEDKFYIVLWNEGGKKYAGKNRKKAGKRSKGGNAGEPDAAV